MSGIVTLSYNEIWGNYMLDSFKNGLPEEKNIGRNTTMKETLLKLHAMIFENYDPVSGREIRGIIYTSGFAEGYGGYLVTNTGNGTTKLKVNRCFKCPLTFIDKVEPNLFDDELIYGEYIVDNYVYVVYFKSEWHDDQVILPPHELISIS